MTKLFEPRQVAIAKGISLEQAIAIMHETPGKTRYWVWHDCAECPVSSVASKDEVGEDWECPECQRDDVADEITFEEFKVLEEPPKAKPNVPSPKDGEGAQWLISTGVTDISDFGCKLANMLDQWQRGIYHIGKEVRHKRVNWKSDRYIELVLHGTFSTFDDDRLTRLVFLAHNYRIRVEVSAAAKAYMKFQFSPRKESGYLYERHPGLLEAVQDWTGLNI